MCEREKHGGALRIGFHIHIHYSHALGQHSHAPFYFERSGRTDIVLLDYAPKRPGVGRADGLPFIEDRCAAVEERAVGDV